MYIMPSVTKPEAAPLREEPFNTISVCAVRTASLCPIRMELVDIEAPVCPDLQSLDIISTLSSR